MIALFSTILLVSPDITPPPQQEQTTKSSPEFGRNTFRAVSLDIIEQEQILGTLAFTNWNKSQAAQILGIERSTLDRKIKKYEMERPAK